MLTRMSGFGASLFVISTFVFVLALLDVALAQVPTGDAGALQPLVNKTDQLRGYLIRIGQALVGLIAVVLMILALTGRVPWMWVTITVGVGVLLTGFDQLYSFLNS